MPGDVWQKFANLRLLLGYMYSQPGKKLLFMGGEFGQWNEWMHFQSLDWHLLQYPLHQKLQSYTRELNRLYVNEPAMYEVDFYHEGFSWIDFSDTDACVVSFIRKAKNDPGDYLIFVFNFTPVVRAAYKVGVPEPRFYKEIFNSDADIFGGSNKGNLGGVAAEKFTIHGRPCSVSLTVPPLGMVVLKPA
jgi:1,4-alpha-glucan branching enzyme